MFSRDGDRARFARLEQPRRKMGRFANHRVRRGTVASVHVANHHQARRDTSACLHCQGEPTFEFADSPDRGKSRAHRALGVVLVGARVSEKKQHSIARALGQQAAVALDHSLHAVAVRRHDFAQVLGVEARREGHGPDHAAGHDGELPSLGTG